MNGSGFGFGNYPQRKSVKPAQVGAALAQISAARQQQPVANAAAPAPGGAPIPGGPQFGAAPASGFMQNPHAEEPGPSPALKMAVTEALRRRGSGGDSRGQQGLPGAPGNDLQLARLGLSPTEIQLLHMGGSTR
jgi:hypothetical protein